MSLDREVGPSETALIPAKSNALLAKLKVVALGIFLVIIVLPAVLSWWAQPVHAFLGREQWHDGTDFGAFYAAGKLVGRGDGHDLYHVDVIGPVERAAVVQFPADRVSPYLNPPFFAGLMAPLAQLPFKDAYRVWTILNFALIAASCLMLWQLSAGLSKPWRVGLALGTLALYPTTSALREGQFSFILVASWLATYMLLRSGRSSAAGLAFIPILIKPELALPVLLFFAWKRDWRFVGSFGVAATVLALVSIAIVGPNIAIHYPHYLAQIASRDGYGTNTAAFFGWNGALAATVGSGHASLVTLAALPLVALTFAAVAYAARGRLDTRSAGFPYVWAMLSLAAVLADPHFYVHDIVLVVAAVAGAFVIVARRQPGLAVSLGLASWTMLALGFSVQDNLHLNPFTLLLAASIAMMAVALERSRRSVSQGTAHPAENEIALAAA